MPWQCSPALHLERRRKKKERGSSIKNGCQEKSTFKKEKSFYPSCVPFAVFLLLLFNRRDSVPAGCSLLRAVPSLQPLLDAVSPPARFACLFLGPSRQPASTFRGVLFSPGRERGEAPRCSQRQGQCGPARAGLQPAQPAERLPCSVREHIGLSHLLPSLRQRQEQGHWGLQQQDRKCGNEGLDAKAWVGSLLRTLGTPMQR